MKHIRLLQMLGFSEAGGGAWSLLQMLGFSEAGGGASCFQQILDFFEAALARDFLQVYSPKIFALT